MVWLPLCRLISSIQLINHSSCPFAANGKEWIDLMTEWRNNGMRLWLLGCWLQFLLLCLFQLLAPKRQLNKSAEMKQPAIINNWMNDPPLIVCLVSIWAFPKNWNKDKQTNQLSGSSFYCWLGLFAQFLWFV